MSQLASSPGSHPPGQHPRPGAALLAAGPARRRHPQRGSSPTPRPAHPGWASKAPRLQPPGLSSTPAPALCVNSPNRAQLGWGAPGTAATATELPSHRAARAADPSLLPAASPRGGFGLWRCGWAAGSAVPCPQPSAPSGDRQQHPPRALGTGPACGRTHSQPHCFPKTRLPLGCAQETCQEGAGTKPSAWERPSPWLQGQGALCPVPQAALPGARSRPPQPTLHCRGEGAQPQSWGPAPASQPRAGLFLLAWAGAAHGARNVRNLPWGLVLLLTGPSREKRGPWHHTPLQGSHGAGASGRTAAPRPVPCPRLVSPRGAGGPQTLPTMLPPCYWHKKEAFTGMVNPNPPGSEGGRKPAPWCVPASADPKTGNNCSLRLSPPDSPQQDRQLGELGRARGSATGTLGAGKPDQAHPEAIPGEQDRLTRHRRPTRG